MTLPEIPPHELLKMIASTITAIGIIGGAYALLWGNLASKIVQDGIKKIRPEALTENEFFKNLEEKDKEIIDKLDKIADGVESIDEYTKQNRTAIKRQELLFLIQTEPRRIETIERVYTEYLHLGGNSYVTELVEIWRKNHAQPEIEDRLLKTATPARKRATKRKRS